ncbi:MAG TPA: heparinase II/III family protein [Verrucomicrobiae bacterium]|nr:heparinase II/III family protein [Verrucomicrobiae bacterium]
MKTLIIGRGGRDLTRIGKLVMAVAILLGALNSPAAVSSGTDLLARLRPEHPRLLITTNDMAALRAAATTNAETAAILTRTEAAARLAMAKPLLTYDKKGRRLLAVSREALRRICLWSFAYRLTGDKVLAERAEKEMLNLAAFNDWNPSHFLDTAEMTAAMAIGYDWLFDALTVSNRITIRDVIVAKGIDPALDPKARWNGWQRTENNWNQVCFGGLTLGALAIAEDEPARVRELLSRARTNNLAGLRPYAPDGVYPEGPSYWGYGTTYQVLMLAALESALSTDWELSAAPGFLASAASLVQQTGPTGRPFNFADGGEGVAFRAALFWFAQKLNRPDLVYSQHRLLQQRLAEKGRELPEEYLLPLLAKWTAALPKNLPPPALPLAWRGGGPNPVGIFRSSWTDSNALYLAFKGGSARVNHGHMDAGSFVLECDGVRWACDLGAQDYYSIESKGWSLFKRTQDSDRWRVYRLNNFSHNTLTLDGQLHNMAGDARITQFGNNEAAVDLSAIFEGQATKVTRQFTVGNDRTVLILDEIRGGKPRLPVRWQMVTRAEARVDGTRAELRQDGRMLRATIISPEGASFEVVDAQPPDDGVNQKNPNTRILAVNSTVPASGNLTLTVQLKSDSATAR